MKKVRRFRVWLVPILLFAFTVRVIGLGSTDLWLDEAISYFIANRAVPDIVAYTASHAWEHPPGFYLLLHFWMQFAGASEFSLRFLSIIGAMLAVVLTVQLARRWFNDLIAILVALLVAVQPMMVQAARDTRMYAWMMAIVLLSVYLFDRSLAHNRWRDWALFLAVLLLAISFHYLAGLVVLAYAVYLIILWRKLGSQRIRLALILVFIFGAAFLWVFTQAGPRTSLLGAITTRVRAGSQMADLGFIYAIWVLGNVAYNLSGARLLAFALPSWLLVLVGAIDLIRPRQWKRLELRWLLLVLILVPSVALDVAFPLPNARHSAMALGLLSVVAALGIVALARKSRLIGILSLIAVMGMDLALIYQGQPEVARPFSAPMDYIGARARAGEALVHTYPADLYQSNYYNHRQLPIYLIPPNLEATGDDVIQGLSADVMAQNYSTWLVLYPSLLQPQRVEETFNRLAFPAEKVWFAGSRGVVHYFSALPMAEKPGGPVWENQIRLRRWWLSDPAAVAAGDAFRLQFEWEPVQLPVTRAVVTLSLVGPDGLVWAKRAGEPCNDRCLTTEWKGGPVTDRQAFFIPPDVPPGPYELRLQWLTPQGVSLLQRNPGDSVAQADTLLARVQILPPTATAPSSAPLDKLINVSVSKGLTLRSAQYQDTSLHGGDTLMLPLQLAVETPQPALDAQLVLKRNGEQLRVRQALGPAWYPSPSWTPGRTIRTLVQFPIAGTIAPGAYQAYLEVTQAGDQEEAPAVLLGNLTVQERDHRYDIPEIGVATASVWHGGVRLVRAAVPGQAHPGDVLPVTLVWQSSGPTDRNWKIFMHLINAAGSVLAQGDAYPAGGSAPSITWQAGEAIVDTHRIELPRDLPEGVYSIRLGFYDERTGERLPLNDGDNSVILPAQLTVTGSANGK